MGYKETKHPNGKTYGCHYLYVGVHLFRAMMLNYLNSLERKRVIRNEINHNPKYINQDGSRSSWNKGLTFEDKRKFSLSKEELVSRLEVSNFSEIGRGYGVSGNAIKKRCKLLGIELGDRRKLGLARQFLKRKKGKFNPPIEEFKQYFAESMRNVRAMSRIYNVSRDAVKRYCQTWGIETPSHQGFYENQYTLRPKS